MRKAVFFDRDGVLNKAVVENGKCFPPPDAAALEISPHARECLLRLKQAGYLCICVTNQPDFSRGTRTLDNIAEMNAKVRDALPLDDLYTCLHDTADNCACRKPRPGMLLEAAEKWSLNLSDCWMVGDRKSDIEAGHAAGCNTIFLDCGYDLPAAIRPRIVCTSLAEVSSRILSFDSYNEK